ncbi:MAG: hypothetical protein KDD42_08835, partial [Bdellovibrionales bacterium]|nr:hypothetical protein [Bdellovibrionales bacterium]
MVQSFDKETIVNEQRLQHSSDARTGRSISELTLEELGLPPGVIGFKGEEAIIDEAHRDYELNEAELLANRAVELVQQRFGEELPPGFPLVKTSRQMREGMSLEDL